MSQQHTPYWTEDVVMAYLKDAAAIHRRLPEVQVPGYFTLWPETLKDDWARLYDQVNGKPRLGPPMPPEVTYQEQVMEWLRLLGPEHQKIVWMRANRIPWKILVAEFGRCRTTLWSETKFCCSRMASRLNAIDREGARFRNLRERAVATA